jgi:hypothetical protein
MLSQTHSTFEDEILFPELERKQHDVLDIVMGEMELQPHVLEELSSLDGDFAKRCQTLGEMTQQQCPIPMLNERDRLLDAGIGIASGNDLLVDLSVTNRVTRFDEFAHRLDHIAEDTGRVQTREQQKASEDLANKLSICIWVRTGDFGLLARRIVGHNTHIFDERPVLSDGSDDLFLDFRVWEMRLA